MDEQQYYKDGVINRQSSESNNKHPVEITKEEQGKWMKSIHEEQYHFMTDSEILDKLNSDSSEEKEMVYQQVTEEQVILAWETLDDSMIDNTEEENQKWTKCNLRMQKRMILIFRMVVE